MESLHSGVHCLAGLSGNTNRNVVLRFLFQKSQNQADSLPLRLPTTVSPSQWPSSVRESTISGRSSMLVPYTFVLRDFYDAFSVLLLREVPRCWGTNCRPIPHCKGFWCRPSSSGKSLSLVGIADTGINRPLFRTHLRDDPLNKWRGTLVNAVRLVAILSVFLVHSVPTLCAITGSTAPTARSGAVYRAFSSLEMVLKYVGIEQSPDWSVPVSS